MPTVDENIEVSITPKKPVMVATPLKDGEAAPILDEEKYETLNGMLASRDEGNHKIAQLILNTCDIEKSIYWIWKLACNGYAFKMVNLRTKASRAFRDKSSLFDLPSLHPLRFAESCQFRAWLTPEIYMKLEDDIVEALARKFNNTFYEVEFKIKDAYKHLPLTKTTIKLKDEETTG